MKHLQKPVFLSARWENLILANYKVDPSILTPYIPKCTELDFFHGECYVSLVGFNFVNTKVMDFEILFHKDFEEFNLRFYVKHLTGGKWRRGVVFIREIVPKPAIAWIAKMLYHEPYVFHRMKNAVKISKESLSVQYSWKINGKWNFIKAEAENKECGIAKDSIEEFITEHYWGYNQFSDSCIMEYEVEHPVWNIYPIRHFEIQCDYRKMYPNVFLPYLAKEPDSVILAKGSDVLVRKGTKIFLDSFVRE